MFSDASKMRLCHISKQAVVLSARDLASLGLGGQTRWLLKPKKLYQLVKPFSLDLDGDLHCFNPCSGNWKRTVAFLSDLRTARVIHRCTGFIPLNPNQNQLPTENSITCGCPRVTIKCPYKNTHGIWKRNMFGTKFKTLQYSNTDLVSTESICWYIYIYKPKRC